MNIDNDTLKQLEALAKLHISDGESEIALKKITSILDMLDKVDMASIADCAPLYHPLEIDQALREDIADNQIDRTLLQAQSPQVENGLFLVPKVIE